MELNKNVLFIILILISNIVNGQQWPINQTDDQNYYNRISGTFGEIHPTGSDHFHGAIDIDNNTVDCPARTIQEGRVYAKGTISIGIEHEYGGAGIYHRRSRYLHVIADSALDVNSDVSQGDQIATIENSSATSGNHLHFEMWQFQDGEWFRINPLNNDLGWELNNPTDTHLPEINDIVIQPLTTQANNVGSGFSILSTNGAISNYDDGTAKVHFMDRPGSISNTFDFENDKLVVFGNVAPIASVRDLAVNSTTAAGNGLTIQKILYRINNNLKFELNFDRVRDSELYETAQVFHTGFNSNNDHLFGNNDFIELRSLDNEYVFPNKLINGIQSNGIWYTKALNTTNHVFNTTPLNAAPVNSEALYQDGEHTLNFEIEDASGINEFVDLEVIVDNFKPYVKSVSLSTADGTFYDREWNWSNGMLQLGQDNGNLSIPSGGSDIDITIITSEPLQELIISITTLGINDQEAIPVTTGVNKYRYWTYHIRAGSTIAGTHTIEFNGQDYAGNYIQIDPTEIPTKNADGTWNGTVNGGVGLADTNHFFEIHEQCDTPPEGRSEFQCPLIADFIHEMDTEQAFTVNFTDQSYPADEITAWFWEFGDGGTSTKQNPSHTYNAVSNYSVKLTVSRESETDDKILNIDVSNDINPIIFVSPTTGTAPLIVNLNSSSSTGIITSRTWNITPAEGWRFTHENIHSVNPKVEFYRGGAYEVSLTIEDGLNEIESAPVSVIVKSESGLEPIAIFNWSGSPFPGGNIYFNNTSLFGCFTSGQPEYHWDFGDGNTSFIENPNHSYSSQGDYNVTLKITDGCGQSNSHTKKVSIEQANQNLFPKIYPGGITALPGQEITFNDESTPHRNINMWGWHMDLPGDFQGRETSNADFLYGNPSYGYLPYKKSVKHTYEEKGLHKIQLEVRNDPYSIGPYTHAYVTVIGSDKLPASQSDELVQGTKIIDMDMSGNKLAVLADYKNGRDYVQVYEKNNDNWKKVFEKNESPFTGVLKRKLAIDGNTVIAERGFFNAIQVYEKEGSTWNSTATASIWFEALGFKAGQTIYHYPRLVVGNIDFDISGNTIVAVTQEKENESASTNKSYVYFIEKGQDGWPLGYSGNYGSGDSEIIPKPFPRIQIGEESTSSNAPKIAIYGNTVVAQTRNDLYIIVKNEDGEWVQQAKISSSSGKKWGDVEIENNTIVAANNSVLSLPEPYREVPYLLYIWEPADGVWKDNMATTDVLNIFWEESFKHYDKISAVDVDLSGNVISAKIRLYSGYTFVSAIYGWKKEGDSWYSDKNFKGYRANYEFHKSGWMNSFELAVSGSSIAIGGDVKSIFPSLPDYSYLNFYDVENYCRSDKYVDKNFVLPAGNWPTIKKGDITLGGGASEATIQSGAKVTYKASRSKLKKGFTAKSGSTVRVKAVSCEQLEY